MDEIHAAKSVALDLLLHHDADNLGFRGAYVQVAPSSQVHAGVSARSVTRPGALVRIRRRAPR